MKLIKPSRRQILQMMTAGAATAATFNPVRALVDSLVEGAMQKAQAETTGTTPPRNYVYIAFPGGPCRWNWDLPLSPYAALNSANYTYPTGSLNPGLINRFKAGTKVGELGSVVVTAPISKVKLRMPHIWGWDIPTSSGSWVPMANLLDNMIFMRGVESIDGHLDSQVVQLRPRAGSPSIDGSVADRSTRAVPALALAGSPAKSFGSATGVGNLRIENVSEDANPLRAILAPFDRNQDGLSGTFLSRRDAMNTVVQQALSALGAAAQARTPGADILAGNRSVAEKMIKQGVGDVSSVYSTLLRKYKMLCALCAREHQLGKAIGVLEGVVAKSSLSAGGEGNGVGGFTNNVNDLFNYDNNRPDQYSTSLAALPESFAITEYLLVNGYSSTIIGGCTGVNGLNTGGFTPWGWDEHGAPSELSFIMGSYAFRSVAACLYELTNRLKDAKIFDETLIHLGGEFSRSPRNDKVGSDHSPQGNAMSLISGAIKSPCVIGNTQPTTGDSMHQGNYGQGDHVQFDGGLRPISTGNQSSTIAKILRVTAPISNDTSMLAESANGFVPIIELAKNKGETA